MRTLNDGLRKNRKEAPLKTKQKMKDAIAEISKLGMKVSKKEVERRSGISYPIVIKYWDEVASEISGVRLEKTIKVTQLKEKNVKLEKENKQLRDENSKYKDMVKNLDLQVQMMREYIRAIQSKKRG